jgi:hypothetical protein
MTFVIFNQAGNEFHSRLCICDCYIKPTPCVVTGEKNSPTVAHVCRKRRLKWVLGSWGCLQEEHCICACSLVLLHLHVH